MHGPRLAEKERLRMVGVIYVSVVSVMSVVTFGLYGWDKRQARLERWRVAEETLQTMALLGGWPGALVGRHVLRHKTRKRGFTWLLYAIVLLHGVIVGSVIYLTR